MHGLVRTFVQALIAVTFFFSLGVLCESLLQEHVAKSPQSRPLRHPLTKETWRGKLHVASVPQSLDDGPILPDVRAAGVQ